MNRRSNIHFGPGAASLILIFVVLSMSILGMLALIHGRSDAQLSRRSAQVIEAVYQLNERAELRRGELDALIKNHADYAALLPEDVTLEDGALCWTEEDGLRTLDCALSVQDGRAAWLRHDMTAETEDDW